MHVRAISLAPVGASQRKMPLLKIGERVRELPTRADTSCEKDWNIECN